MEGSKQEKDLLTDIFNEITDSQYSLDSSFSSDLNEVLNDVHLEKEGRNKINSITNSVCASQGIKIPLKKLKNSLLKNDSGDSMMSQTISRIMIEENGRKSIPSSIKKNSSGSPGSNHDTGAKKNLSKFNPNGRNKKGQNTIITPHRRESLNSNGSKQSSSSKDSKREERKDNLNKRKSGPKKMIITPTLSFLEQTRVKSQSSDYKGKKPEIGKGVIENFKKSQFLQRTNTGNSYRKEEFNFDYLKTHEDKTTPSSQKQLSKFNPLRKNEVEAHTKAKQPKLSTLLSGIDIIKNFHKKLQEKRVLKQINKLIIEEKIREVEEPNETDKRERELDLLPAEWQEKIQRDLINDPYSLFLEERFTLRSVYLETKRYNDDYPFLELRKRLHFMKKSFTWFCYKIATSSLIKLFGFLMTFINSIIIIIRVSGGEGNWKIQLIEFSIFCYFFIEMIIFMFGFGLFFGKGAYFKSGWMIFEFCINMLTLTYCYVYNTGLSFAAFRQIRFLTMMNSIDMQRKLNSFFSAFALLFEIFIIVFIFQLFFAIFSLHLFSGCLLNRCFYPESGKMYSEGKGSDYVCGNRFCPDGLICGKGLENPDNGITTFDNIINSYLLILKIITTDEWTPTVNLLQRSFSGYSWIYFLILILICNYFILNLILAVLKVKYSEIHHQSQTVRKQDYPIYNLKELKEKGVYASQKRSILKFQSYSQRELKKVKVLFNNEAKLSFSAEKTKNDDPVLGAENMTETNVPLFQKRKAASPKNMKKTLWNFNRKTSLNGFLFNQLVHRFLALFYEGDKLDHVNPNYLIVKVREGNQSYNYRSYFDIFPKKYKKIRIKKILLKQRKLIKNIKLKIDYDISEVLLNANLKFKLKVDNKKSLKKVKRIAGSKKGSVMIRLPVLKKFSGKSETDIPEFKRKRALKGETHIDFSKNENKIVSMVEKKPQKPIRTFFEGPMTYQEAREIINDGFGESSSDSFSDEEGEELYMKIREQDITEKKISKENWSGNNVLTNLIELEKIFQIIIALTFRNPNIWITTLKGRVSPKTQLINSIFILIPLLLYPLKAAYLKKLIRSLVNSSIFKNIFIIVVILNTISMALVGIVDEDTLNKMNFIFFLLFGLELFLKMIGFGIRGFISKNMNILDSIILSYTAFDIGMNSADPDYREGAFHEVMFLFRSLDSIVVLRVVRILLYLDFMQFIIEVIGQSLSNFMNIAFILFLMMISYSLMGMQIFKGNFDLSSDDGLEKNFETFYTAFITVLDIVTLDGWYKVIVLGFNNSGKIATFIFVVTEIYFLHFIILNLFIALLLHGFENTTNQEKQKQIEILQEKNWLKEQINQNKDQDEESKWGAVTNNSIKSKLSKASDSKKNSRISNFNDLEFTDRDLVKDPRVIEDSTMRVESKENQQNLNKSLEVDNDESPKTEKNDYDFQSKPLNNFSMSGSEVGSRNKKKKFTYKNSILYRFDIRQHLHLKEEFIYFKGMEANFSLFFLSKENFFRKFCYKITFNPLFEILKSLVIFLSVINLSIDTYSTEALARYKIVTFYFNIILNSFFALEATLKIVSSGFILNQKAYLREILNFVDFIATLSFFLDLATEDENLPALKAVTLFRMLRPLRIIYDNDEIRLIFKSLMNSMKEIINVMLILFAVWLIFGILGVTLFRRKFGFCEFKSNFGIGQKKCQELGLEWKINKNNFENIFNALYNLMVISTIDNWGSLLSVATHSNTANYGPTKNFSQFSSYFYFISFIIIGTWFFLNLFIGVIFSNFIAYQKKSRHDCLSDNQVFWITVQKNILQLKLKPIYYPNSRFQKLVLAFTQSKLASMLLNISFILNVLIMCSYYEGAPRKYKDFLATASFALTLSYSTEFILKVVVRGFSRCFRIFWDFFDLMVTLSFIIDQFIEYYVSPDLMLEFPIFKFLKALRVFGISRLLRQFQGFKTVYRTILISFRMLMNILLLGTVVFFCFAIFGCYLFSGVKTGEVIDEYTNFSNFANAMMTLFRCSTADNWNKLMFDLSKTKSDGCEPKVNCGSAWSPVYFISFIFIINYILINIIILVLLQQFEILYKSPNNPIQLFKTTWNLFQANWFKKCLKDNQSYIPAEHIEDFVLGLPEIFGFKNEIKNAYLKKTIMKMNLVNNSGFVHYIDLFYNLLRRIVFEEIYENTEIAAKKELLKFEKEFFYKLEEIKVKEVQALQRNELKRKKKKSSIFINVMKLHTVNPLPNFFKKKLFFLVWRNYIRMMVSAKENENQFNSKIMENSSSCEEGRMLILEKEQVMPSLNRISYNKNNLFIPNFIDNN